MRLSSGSSIRKHYSYNQLEDKQKRMERDYKDLYTKTIDVRQKGF